MKGFFYILLLISPSLSLTYYITGIYIPNDKYIYLYSFIREIFQNNFLTNIQKKQIIFFFSIIILYIVGYTKYGRDITISDINFLLTYTLIPSFAKLFGSKEYFKQSVITYAVVACLYGLLQQILLNVGLQNILHTMLTYPAQVESLYVIDSWAPRLFRVPGFQLESSQYAFMLTIAYIILDKSNFNNKKYIRWFFIVSIIINGSTTGYLALIAYYIFKGTLKSKISSLVYLAIIFMILMNANIDSLKTAIDNQLEKVEVIYELFTQGSTQTASERWSGFEYAFSNLPNMGNLFIGYGLNFYGGYDILSVSVIGIGLIGVMITFIYIGSYFSTSGLIILPPLLIFMLSNGSLLDPNYCLIFSYLVCNKIYEKN